MEIEIEQFLERKKVIIKKIEYNCYDNKKVYAKYTIIKPQKLKSERLLEELKEKIIVIKVDEINK